MVRSWRRDPAPLRRVDRVSVDDGVSVFGFSFLVFGFSFLVLGFSFGFSYGIKSASGTENQKQQTTTQNPKPKTQNGPVTHFSSRVSLNPIT
jgi:hypothetical protein